MKECNCYSEIDNYTMNKITGKPIHTNTEIDTRVFFLIFLPNKTTMPLHTFNLHRQTTQNQLQSTFRKI